MMLLASCRCASWSAVNNTTALTRENPENHSLNESLSAAHQASTSALVRIEEGVGASNCPSHTPLLAILLPENHRGVLQWPPSLPIHLRASLTAGCQATFVRIARSASRSTGMPSSNTGMPPSAASSASPNVLKVTIAGRLTTDIAEPAPVLGHSVGSTTIGRPWCPTADAGETGRRRWSWRALRMEASRVPVRSRLGKPSLLPFSALSTMPAKYS